MHVHNLIGGLGVLKRIPPPMPRAVMPRYDTPILHVRPSINPDLTNRLYLMTTLSASQADTWHTYFTS